MEPFTLGMVVEATVERIEPCGAWIECQGRRGLVPIHQVSWSRIRHPGNVLSVGQRLEVKVLGLQEDIFGKLYTRASARQKSAKRELVTRFYT